MKIIDLHIAASALKNGEVIVIPTETVYGIAADARNKSAVELIYKIKKRDSSKPLQLMVSNIDSAKRYLEFDKRSKKIAKKFLPGPLTMILEKKPSSILAENLNSADNTLGLRIPDHSILFALLSMINFPIAATSANISGSKDPVNITQAVKNLKGKDINYALDGGECKISTPSTVADFTSSDKIKIVRPGEITLEDIENQLFQ